MRATGNCTQVLCECVCGGFSGPVVRPIVGRLCQRRGKCGKWAADGWSAHSPEMGREPERGHFSGIRLLGHLWGPALGRSVRPEHPATAKCTRAVPTLHLCSSGLPSASCAWPVDCVCGQDPTEAPCSWAGVGAAGDHRAGGTSPHPDPLLVLPLPPVASAWEDAVGAAGPPLCV